MAGLRRSTSSVLRWLILVLIALMVPAVAAAEPPAQAPVRMGVTEAAPASAGPAEERPGADPEIHAPPSDAPRIEPTLKMPPPPASYNVHDGGWIRFAYEPGVRERVQPLITQADGVRADFVRRFGIPVLSKVTVYVARTAGEMATLAPEGAPFPRYASGVAYSEIGLVLLTIHPVDVNAQHDLGEVFRHELSHVALWDAVGGHPVPRWFNEGLAVFASGEGSFTRLGTLWQATTSDQLMPLKRMERTFPLDAVGVNIAYAEAADVVRFLLRREDHERFVGLMERLRKGQEFEASLRDSYGVDMATLEFEWRQDVARRYTFWPAVFSGSVIWMGAIAIFVWGWRRRKRRDKATLDRWGREEAVEEELRRRLREAEARRVHIVLASSPARTLEVKPPVEEPSVPQIEHDGRWHTLH